jgi:hypothetical protein
MVFYVLYDTIEYVIPHGFPECRVGRKVFCFLTAWSHAEVRKRLLLYADAALGQFLGHADGHDAALEHAIYSATPEWHEQHTDV